MSRLSGVIPAIPTPLLENEDLDAKSLCKLIDHVIDQGAAAVFILGNMGEGAALMDSVRLNTVEAAVKHIDGRVPLMAACSNGSTRRTIELGKQMQDLGPDHLVATPPYYYKFPYEQCLINYYEDVSKALQKPVWVYNNPGSTGHNPSVDTLEAILQLDNIIGIKDSCLNVHTAMALLRKYPDKKTRPFAYLSGDEFAYDVVVLSGADGIVTGGGTCFVDTLVELYNAATAGKQLQSFELQKKFRDQMDEMLGPDLSIDWMAAIKTNLKNKGLCDNNCTHPFINRLRD